MQKNEDILKAIIGAAILGGMAEQKSDGAENKNWPQMTAESKAANTVRKLYDAFIDEGFTEKQATRFVTAIIAK